jgi:hypothetical protein
MIFTNIESYYTLFILIILFYTISIYNKKFEIYDNYFHYICKSWHPIRNLKSEKEICKNYRDSFLLNAFDMNLNTEEIQLNFQSLVAEYIIILITQKIEITDPYVKIKFDTKLYRILETYSKCYGDNVEDYKDLLILKILDILKEIYIDIFNTSRELRKILNQNKYCIKTFDNYCKYQKTFKLNIEDLNLNLEEIENLYNIIKSKTF